MKKFIFLTITTILILGLFWVVPRTHPAEAAAPDNDEFANARVITSLPYADTVDTTEATTNPLDPISYGDYPEKSVWYRFTLAQNMNVTFDNSKANYATSIGFYTGDYAAGLTLVQYGYGSSGDYQPRYPLYAGVTYYIQIIQVSSPYPLPEGERAILTFELTQVPGPENDFFADATPIESLPYSTTVNLEGAFVEYNEPRPAQGFFSCINTVWYQYIPTVETIVYGTAYSNFYKAMFIFQGENYLDAEYDWVLEGDYATFAYSVTPGQTYYFQFCSFGENDIEFPFYLTDTPLVYPDFYTNPSYPYSGATVEFCDNSYDPGGSPMVYYWWDFGDGTTLEGEDACVKHWFAEDGEYFIWHKVQPEVGRPAEMGEIITLESHDVSAAYVKTPYWLEVGKTYQFHVGVQSKYAYEDVRVYLLMLSRKGEMSDWLCRC